VGVAEQWRMAGRTSGSVEPLEVLLRGVRGVEDGARTVCARCSNGSKAGAVLMSACDKAKATRTEPGLETGLADTLQARTHCRHGHIAGVKKQNGDDDDAGGFDTNGQQQQEGQNTHTSPQ